MQENAHFSVIFLVLGVKAATMSQFRERRKAPTV